MDPNRIGPSYFSPNSPGSPSGEVQANSNAELDVSVFPTHYVAGTVQLMNISLTWNNIIGEPGQQLNQVYFNVLPNP
ncbi:MAG TPA: hypothetical protein VEH06_04345 [Candidatus Bathyarchaeia archaeon]|nr:hypothetical protein [Candidatus Bathyarchaeia archaeon]